MDLLINNKYEEKTERQKSDTVSCKQYNHIISVFVPFFENCAYFINLYILYFYFISYV